MRAAWATFGDSGDPAVARREGIANDNNMLGACASKCSASVALRVLGELVRPTFSFCIHLQSIGETRGSLLIFCTYFHKSAMLRAASGRCMLVALPLPTCVQHLVDVDSCNVRAASV